MLATGAGVETGMNAQRGDGRTRAGDDRVVAALVEARLTGAVPPLGELDGDFDDALAVQIAVLQGLKTRGFRQSGWKVGLTSGASYDLMGAGFRPFGFVLAERTFASGVVLSDRPKAGGAIEPELCLRMERPLYGANIPPAECQAAVAEVRAAFEINETRVALANQSRLVVADGLTNWGLVLGGGVPPRAGLSESRVELFVNGRLETASPPQLVMDCPFLSLSRLCTALSKFGWGVDAGQHVLTGAFLKRGLDAPGVYRAAVADIGDVTLIL